eukprot:6646653-Pyramimonas_sp.AAC.1
MGKPRRLAPIVPTEGQRYGERHGGKHRRGIGDASPTDRHTRPPIANPQPPGRGGAITPLSAMNGR